MAPIIKRLRAMTEAGAEDYTLADVIYWRDDALEAVLDRHREFEVSLLLTVIPQYISGSTKYYRYKFPSRLRAIEGIAGGTPGGTAVWRIDDSTGALVDGYTFDEQAVDLLFAADTEGSAYYWTGFSYSLSKAARDVWVRKAAHVWTAINFAADGHKFDREALQAHCLRMASHYDNLAGPQVAKMIRTDLQGPELDLF